jgi:hypothetical protein
LSVASSFVSASTITDDAIKAEWAAGEYTGIVCTGKETPVSVTMDGKDITESCLRDGAIYIESVTGDIHITASAG